MLAGWHLGVRLSGVPESFLPSPMRVLTALVGERAVLWQNARTTLLETLSGVLLAVAAALLSAREDHALLAETVFFGEVSLSGALRPVAQAENRLKEAQKLGFSRAILPEVQKVEGGGGMSLARVADLTSFTGETFGAG